MLKMKDPLTVFSVGGVDGDVKTKEGGGGDINISHSPLMSSNDL